MRGRILTVAQLDMMKASPETLQGWAALEEGGSLGLVFAHSTGLGLPLFRLGTTSGLQPLTTVATTLFSLKFFEKDCILYFLNISIFTAKTVSKCKSLGCSRFFRMDSRTCLTTESTHIIKNATDLDSTLVWDSSGQVFGLLSVFERS